MSRPVAAEEARNLLSLFFLYPWHRSAQEVELLASRVAFDQGVRLQESIDKLEPTSSRLSTILIVLTVVLVVLTAALLYPLVHPPH